MFEWKYFQISLVFISRIIIDKIQKNIITDMFRFIILFSVMFFGSEGESNWASSWDYGTYNIRDRRMLRRASAQSR